MSQPLRVLFYEDPLTDHHAFGWRVPHLWRDAPWVGALAAAGAELRVLVHDRFVGTAVAAGIDRRLLIPVGEDTIAAALPDPQANLNTLFHRHYGTLMGYVADPAPAPEALRAATFRDRMAESVGAALGDFAPNVVISWVPVPHLRALFPDALILHKETAIYARPPYGTSCSLDPLGFHRWSCPRQGGGVAPTPASLDAFVGLKPCLDSGIAATDRWHDFDRLRARHAGTLFLPAQMSGGFLFDGACAYRSQTNMILDVLERVSEDWAVIVNDHPDCPTLSPWERDYIAAAHPNFHYRVNAFYGEGQQIARRVDAVATVSSSLGLQALLWDKPLVALGDSLVPAFTDLTTADLPRLAPDRVSGVEASSWLSFHYAYQNAMLNEAGRLPELLAARLAHWTAHGAQGYFDEPWASPREIAAALADAMDADLRERFGATDTSPSSLVAMDRDACFGEGWSFAEPLPEGAHRWIDGRQAELLLHLDPRLDHVVSISLGIPQDMDQQTVSVSRDGTLLCREDLRAGGQAVVAVPVPARAGNDPIVRLCLGATSTLRPPWEDRNLSVNVERIAIEARRPTPVPASAFSDEGVAWAAA